MLYYFVFNFKTREILDFFPDEDDCLYCLANYREFPDYYFEDPSYANSLLTSSMFVPLSVSDVYDFLCNNFDDYALL